MCTDKKKAMCSAIENSKYLLRCLFSFIVATNLDLYLQTVNKNEALNQL